MGFRIKRGGGSGSLTLPNELIFADTITRDDYFTTNPSKLKDNVYVSVGGTLQKYVDSTWVDSSAVVKGAPGDDAPEMLIQYSATGNSGWSETMNVALHKFWRWSKDNGTTWSPDFVAFSGDGAGGVPEPYNMVVGANGKLQLFKDGELIQEQDETGAWIANSVSTGTGSVHIGELHGMGSGGENVIFLNTDSNLAWYPSWAGVSTDGTQSVNMSARVHGAIDNAEPVGTVATSGSVDYSDTFTAAADVAFFSVDIVPAETFSGRLRWIATKSTGKEVAAFFFDANLVEGAQYSVPFKYPLWVLAGQTFTVQIVKDDGEIAKARPSSTQASKPWRRTHYRPFADHDVFHDGNAVEQAAALNALTGNDRLSANAVRDFPVMSNVQLGMAKLGATMSINGAGELDTAISPTGIKIVADEAARLAIPASGGAILAIQQDTGDTYGIEAGEDTSVLANWRQIGTVATNVVSFNGRNGAVLPTDGDYTQNQIKTVHDDTQVEGYFGIDNTGIYWDDGV